MRTWTMTTLVAALCGAVFASPFTYQGELIDSGNPADGMYDMVFTLADSPVLGLAIQVIPMNDVVVANGLFEVDLDYLDSHFDGSDLWLSISVEGTALNPRTQIQYVPYAIRATSAQRAGLAADLEVPWVVLTDTDVVNATSTRGVPIRGFMNSTSLDNPGVLGETNSLGVGAVGVLGRVNLIDADSSAAGVRGESMGSGIGVYGLSTRGQGVLGISEFDPGVQGSSHTSYGIDGFSNFHYGVRGRTLNGESAVHGFHTTSDTSGSLGTEEYGVEAYNLSTDDGVGIFGSGGGIGVEGHALEEGNGFRIGVRGSAGSLHSHDSFIVGVRGHALTSSLSDRTAYGVYGGATATTQSDTAYGIYGFAFGDGTRYAGYFQGDVHVNGTLSKSSGSFKIDHPMDPENKYLSHSFVESPEMLNVYSGVVTLDTNGRGVVELPHYFDSLNTDYRYQLTALGAAMPSLHVEELIDGNRFVVGGGAGHKQVSWEVTGVRIDASAAYRPIEVEEDKAAHHRGLYLDPEAHGFGDDRAIHKSGRED